VARSERHGNGEDVHVLISQKILVLGTLSSSEAAKINADNRRE
jgi:hypothetical protein